MTETIHPHAIVDPAARIGSSVVIGPFCVVGPDVVLEDGVRLHSHVVVEGRTRIGPGTQIFPFASIGHAPQDLKYHGEPSELIIGSAVFVVLIWSQLVHIAHADEAAPVP